jgi:TRAP-type C4-dicarboxylate transport system permease small subunit
MDQPTAALDEWIRALTAELGLSADLHVDIALILNLAGDAAHRIARPAAPLTTFLVGYAAALGGGTITDIENAARTATRLASQQQTPASTTS